MKQIRDAGYKARWYVVGEGPERKALEKQIAELRLQKDFILLGIKENPFPTMHSVISMYMRHGLRGKALPFRRPRRLAVP